MYACISCSYMAKSKERLMARSLRKQGVSVKTIAKRIGVAKSSASLWVRDIILTVEQLENLKQQNIKGGEKGRLIGALKQKNDRLNRIQEGQRQGHIIFSELNERELLLAGCALYWAEGTKKNRIVSFCNSDPKLIEFMITWLRICFHIPIEELRCYIGVNEIHSHRDNIMKEYWSKKTGIPITQFLKTSFKKVKNKKIYDNFDTHFGTLTVKTVRSARFYYKIMGLIDSLCQSKISSQGSSVVAATVS